MSYNVILYIKLNFLYKYEFHKKPKKEKKAKDTRFFKEEQNQYRTPSFEKQEEKRQVKIDSIMLQKERRIKKKNDFDEIFKKGKNLKSGFLILKILENSVGFNRFGFIVSQKVSKKAVLRNKIRRRLSEIIKKKDFEKKGLDLLLIVLPGMEKLEFQETKEMAEAIFKKAKLLN